MSGARTDSLDDCLDDVVIQCPYSVHWRVSGGS